MNREWPQPEFVATFLTIEQFQRALEEAARSKRGTRFVSALRDLARSGSLEIDDARTQTLAQFCVKQGREFDESLC